MNKTIIAIHGKENEGKSEIIKNVCKLIMETYPKAIASKSPINYNGDILVAIKIGNIKIGLESQGDPNSRMIYNETIKKLADNKNKNIGGCDIIICATRTSGKTVKTVDKIADEFNFNTLWLSSYWSPSLDWEVLNRKAAESIIDIVKSIITEQL